MNASAIYKDPQLYCMTTKRVRKIVFEGGNPLSFGTSILFLQFSLSAVLTAIFQYILTPLGESAFISQMLVGFVLGPTVFGEKNKVTELIFPLESFYVAETFSLFGCMLFMFLAGVKMDIGMVKRSGKKAVVIGLSSFLVPFIINISFALFLRKSIAMDPGLRESVLFIALFECMSCSYVISALLDDLNLLNSELGRLAISSSIVGDFCTYFCVILIFSVTQSSKGKQALCMIFSVICMAAFIVYVLRPIMYWMVERTAEGKPMKESYIFSVFMMILGCAFCSESIGQHLLIGPMILGLVVPGGPPLGSALVDKLESFVSGILLPVFFVYNATMYSTGPVNIKTIGVVELLVLSRFVGKLAGTMVPSLYSKMPLMDALCLGLVMNAKGISDILILQQAMILVLIDQQSYSIMVLSIIVVTGTITPIVKLLYNPSKRYMSFSKIRTIQQAKDEGELRILACIYHQDSTPAIINIFEVSHPTPKNPICFYVIHPIQLLGRASPLLIEHNPGGRSHHSHQSHHIMNAFRLYEQHNLRSVMVNLFTAIAPYATMHNDICTLALDRRVYMVIIPFHKHQTLHGTEEFLKPIRAVNQNVLRKAPCSVGILVDRGTLNASASVSMSRTSYNIGMFFLEGPDDREALAYAMRMAGHPDVRLTVVHFLERRSKGKFDAREEQDCDMINKLRMSKVEKMNQIYQEEIVEDSVEMVRIIKSLENSFDLILVGKGHSSESPLCKGLTQWNEFPELGFIGDMLTASDSVCKVSVLVVQQQKVRNDEFLEGSRSSSVVDISPEMLSFSPAKSIK